MTKFLSILGLAITVLASNPALASDDGSASGGQDEGIAVMLGGFNSDDLDEQTREIAQKALCDVMRDMNRLISVLTRPAMRAVVVGSDTFENLFKQYEKEHKLLIAAKSGAKTTRK